ncbi:hypothetical protein ACTNEF_14720 [Bariatricus sp. HCP28S3_E4]|uniref:hypothetical protein n=1 Tax=unclassified Bariatricus TaxID=2677046 RepID=UPI003F8CDC55
MKKSTAKKSWIMTAVIYAIIFAVFNLLVFVIANEKNGVFWMSYAFMCIAFIVQIASMLLALRSLETETVFMGIPLASLSLYYFFAAIFVGAVFMFFQNAPFKLALVLQILILAIYVVIAIMALMSRNVVQDVNDNLKENVEAIKTLVVDVDVFIPQVNDPALKKSLKKLSETIKYSDPMSNAAVADIEEQIMQTVNELRINIENSRNAEAIQTCKDIEVLFMQRNSLLKATK